MYHFQPALSFFKSGTRTNFIKVVLQTHKTPATKIHDILIEKSVYRVLYMQNHRSYVLLCDG